LIRYQDRAGAVSVVLGHPLLDDYLEFVAARLRRNTLLATAYDLKVFFSVVSFRLEGTRRSAVRLSAVDGRPAERVDANDWGLLPGELL
jgi:hypothetical protein